MSWTNSGNGTQTATVGTEHTLDTPATGGTYELAVDCSNLAAGEAVEIRAYRKVLSGGTAKVAWKGTVDYFGAQINPVVLMPPIPMPYGGKFTLKQLSGTGRNFDWEDSYV